MYITSDVKIPLSFTHTTEGLKRLGEIVFGWVRFSKYFIISFLALAELRDCLITSYRDGELNRKLYNFFKLES